MKKERVIKYKNNNCIIILKNRFKYEGIIKDVFCDSFIILDKKIGNIEIDLNDISLIINPSDNVK